MDILTFLATSQFTQLVFRSQQTGKFLAQCVDCMSVELSRILTSFQWSEGLCLPACASYSFHQENIQYVKVSQNYLSSMRNKLGLPSNVAVTSMVSKQTGTIHIFSGPKNILNLFQVLNLAEQTNKVFEEIADYTSDQFLAEIGGSAGLFLGLSLLTIVEFFASLILLIFDKTMQRNAENQLSIIILSTRSQ